MANFPFVNVRKCTSTYFGIPHVLPDNPREEGNSEVQQRALAIYEIGTPYLKNVLYASSTAADCRYGWKHNSTGAQHIYCPYAQAG